MPVVPLDHGNTGAEMSCECIDGHAVAGECHSGVVVPQAVYGSLLAVSGVV